MLQARRMNTYGSIDMVVVPDSGFKRLQDNDDNSFSPTETAKEYVEYEPRPRMQETTHPFADASNGLHLPSGERIEPCVYDNQSPNLRSKNWLGKSGNETSTRQHTYD